jgi:hypothetical protein
MLTKALYSRTLLLSVIMLIVFSSVSYSSDSFNYSKIAPHPRLLLSKADEGALKKVLKSNVQFSGIHDLIIKKSDEMLSKEALTYIKSGKRLLAVSREALQRIFFLSYSYRMTKNNEYLKRAELELNAVSKFDNWNPTHYLDVGEMTMAVAIGYDWLYDELKDSTKLNIRQAILKNTFETSKVEEYNWYKRTSNNWNQVCNAGVVYGALATFESNPDISKEIIEEMLKTNLLSMESYAPDGAYPEGAGYWAYGTGFEVMLLAALESALGSDNGLSKSPGFLKSAEFMLYVNSPIGMCFNYSDCGASTGHANVPLFWFAKKTNNPNLILEENNPLKALTLTKTTDERLLPIVLIFGKDINFANTTAPKKTVWAGKGITPVVMVRSEWKNTSGEYLGVKGGSASSSHGHMDAGTFVYDSEGLRWAMDFGLQSYITLESKGIDLWNQSQESQRWDVFRLSNKSHNTLTINNKRHNVIGKATLVDTYDTPTEKGGKFDLSEIFKGEISSAMRKVVLKNNKYLQVEDAISTNEKEALIRWNMVTRATVKILDSSSIELTQKGKKKILKVSADFPFELKTWNSEDPGTDYDQKNPGTIMIGFESKVPANQKAKFVITVGS